MTFEQITLPKINPLNELLKYLEGQTYIILLDRTACEKLFEDFPPSNTKDMNEYYFSKTFEISNHDNVISTIEITIKPISSTMFFIDFCTFKKNNNIESVWSPCENEILYFK